MSVTRRLIAIRDHLGLTQKAMAARMGVSGNTWQRCEAHNEPPNAAVLTRLAQEGFDTTWLLTGVGQMRREAAAAPTPPASPAETGFSEPKSTDIGSQDLASHGFVLIPRYELRHDIASNAVVEEQGFASALAFRRDWLERELHAQPATLMLVEMHGDAMAPTISHGNLILVDHAEPRLRGAGLYVFRVGDMLVVRRLQVRLDGGFTLSSDNAARYPAEDITREEFNRIRIIGRIIWSGGRL